MKGLSKILLEGRVEDAQQYFENAVGDWPVAELNNHAGIGDGTNLEGVLQHFVNNDPQVITNILCGWLRCTLIQKKEEHHLMTYHP